MNKCKYCNKKVIKQEYFQEPICRYHLEFSLEIQQAEREAGWNPNP